MPQPSPIQANYVRMLHILTAASLTPVEPDPDFTLLLRDIESLERILAVNGYDVLFVDEPGLFTLTNVGMKTIVARCVKYLADKNRTPESEHVDTTEQRLVASIVDTIKVKNANYGESWSRRGGQGAFLSYVRKTDRLATLVPKYLSGTLSTVTRTTTSTTPSLT